MFARNIFQSIIWTVLKWLQCISKELFTHNVNKIKGAADKNDLKNATCKRTLK